MNKSVVFDTPGTSVKNIKQDEHPYAVVLKNTKVEYGSNIPILGRLKPSNVVLNNCSLVVKRREFFVLLGASSAGKTTLLKAIVGLKNISQGEIWVLGGHPASIYHKTAGSKVGYMPQELAMFGELTIKETLNFFGMIYGMDESIWLFQMRKYSHVLKLPNLERPVKYLSGGQKRRLSFTIAILHKPQLIILDEPCVGVDPLVRKRMWDLLQVFVGKGRTVIMTTQYIEEANDASEVAFLYKGRIIAQDSPDGFKSKYSMPKLSDVFYKITNDDGTSSGPPAETSKAEEPEVKLEYIHTPFIRKIFPDMGTNKMQAMLFKNRIRYTRNWKLILFLLLLPIFQVAIFNATMGSPPAGLKMGVVNYELRGEFERSGNNSPYCPINHDCLIKSPKARKSCTLLSCLDKDTIKLKYFPDEESAEEALKNGETYGTLRFEEGFTPSLSKYAMRTASPDDFKRCQLYVRLDKTSNEETTVLKSEIHSAYQKFREKLADECGQSREGVQMPIVYLPPIYGKNELQMKDFVAPGALCVIVFFLSVSITALTLLTDKTEGLLQRSYVAGVTFTQMLLAHTAIQFLIVLIQAILVVLFHIGVFGNECKGIYILVVILLIFQGMVGANLGFFISAICSKEETAIELSLGLLFPIILLSGMFWTLDGMDPIPRFISRRLPMSYAIVSGRDIMIRGWYLTDWEVTRGLLASIIWAAVFWVLALLVTINTHK
ncbi:hypothetical protein M8J76_002960 [Diaphorina citri]|nr:hypothetical protein M8J76_002960 [Diaphorina citri]